MVRRKLAKGLSWATHKALTVIVLAILLMVFAVPVVILTNAGLPETWAYFALAALLIGLTGAIVWLLVWGVRKTGIYTRGGA